MTDPNTPADPNQPPPPGQGDYGRPPSGGEGQTGRPDGYQQPPAGGYQQQPGAYQQAPVSESDERIWAMVAHFVAIVGFFIPGLVVFLIFKDRSVYLKEQGAEALNWGITMTILEIAAYVLLTISFGLLFFLPFVTFVIRLVFGILAGVAVKDHANYRYPFNLRLVK